jgi:hypothetical protein
MATARIGETIEQCDKRYTDDGNPEDGTSEDGIKDELGFPSRVYYTPSWMVVAWFAEGICEKIEISTLMSSKYHAEVILEKNMYKPKKLGKINGVLIWEAEDKSTVARLKNVNSLEITHKNWNKAHDDILRKRALENSNFIKKF